MKIEETIHTLYDKYKNDLSGQVSSSFPALSLVDPDLFSINVTMVDGKTIEVGDTQNLFSIQSISKPFSYALALEQHGSSFVEEKVGVEPTGEDYDSIIKMDGLARPFNPMVNSGAIVTTGLISGNRSKKKEQVLLDFYSTFAGRELVVDNAIYESERNNGHKNWAIAHLLRHFHLMTKDFKSDLELYFKQCSILVSSSDLALMGATLANGGVNPKTNVKSIERENLRHVLSILLTCGMYNYSGEWVFDVGVPAKSGISGCILMIIPGMMAITVYSPRLDKRGNSVRGIKVCEELSNLLKLHILDTFGPKEIKEIL